jgi:hypothetical protein
MIVAPPVKSKLLSFTYTNASAASILSFYYMMEPCGSDADLKNKTRFQHRISIAFAEEYLICLFS